MTDTDLRAALSALVTARDASGGRTIHVDTIRDALTRYPALDEASDLRAAHRIAADVADRFRDLVEECLDLPENPGDDELVAQLRSHFGKTGPESRRWRDFMVGAEAMRDQILAAHPAPAPESAEAGEDHAPAPSPSDRALTEDEAALHEVLYETLEHLRIETTPGDIDVLADAVEKSILAARLAAVEADLAAMTREARLSREATEKALRAERERLWDEGYASGSSNAMRRMSDEPNAPTTPNPYARKEGER